MSMRTYRFAIIALGVFIALGILLACTTAHAETTDYPSFWQMDAKLVKTVQKALNERGTNLKADGDFGPATAQAVKDFQLSKGMKVTGVVDDDTADKLGLRNAEWPYGDGYTLYYMADFGKKAPAKGYTIYIALGGRSQTPHLGVFKDGRLVAETACITGNQNDGDFTPVGVHTIGKKSDSRISDSGYYYYNQCWLKLKGKEDSNIAIHSMLHKWNGELVAGQTLGTQKSHGCIRIPDDLADWLRHNLSKGTTVIIDDRAWSPSSIGYATLLNY